MRNRLAVVTAPVEFLTGQYCNSQTNSPRCGTKITTWSQHIPPSLSGKNDVRDGWPGTVAVRSTSVKVAPASVEKLMPPRPFRLYVDKTTLSVPRAAFGSGGIPALFGPAVLRLICVSGAPIGRSLDVPVGVGANNSCGCPSGTMPRDSSSPSFGASWGGSGRGGYTAVTGSRIAATPSCTGIGCSDGLVGVMSSSRWNGHEPLLPTNLYRPPIRTW